MPVRIEFVEQPKGVILYSLGTVTGAELIAAIQEVYADDRYPSLRYWLGDHSGCDYFLPTTQNLRRIGAINRQESLRNPGILLALVGPGDEAFGVCRQFEPFNDGSKYVTHVFRTREEAEAWITEMLAGE